MPENVAKDMATILNGHELSISDSNILLLGWSYKAGIGDPRETPAEPLAVALGAMGATVQTFDPLVDDRLFPTDLATLVRAEDDISPFDIAILVTAHDEVIGMDWAKLSEKSNQPIIYDGRRVLNVEMLESLGWCVYLLGAPL